MRIESRACGRAHADSLSRTRECLRRGRSIQSAGGPRLNGSPGIAAPPATGRSIAISWLPGEHGIAATGKGGNTNPVDAQRSQRNPDCGASLSPESALAVEAVLTLQMPPSLPVRTSCASMATGATNADKTARKASHAARRTQMEAVELDDAGLDTRELYACPPLSGSPDAVIPCFTQTIFLVFDREDAAGYEPNALCDKAPHRDPVGLVPAPPKPNKVKPAVDARSPAGRCSRRG